MPLSLRNPRIGQVNDIKFEEMVHASNIAKTWTKTLGQANSQIRNLTHDNASDKPKITVTKPIEFQYAAILPMFHGKYVKIQVKF